MLVAFLFINDPSNVQAPHFFDTNELSQVVTSSLDQTYTDGPHRTVEQICEVWGYLVKSILIRTRQRLCWVNTDPTVFVSNTLETRFNQGTRLSSLPHADLSYNLLCPE